MRIRVANDSVIQGVAVKALSRERYFRVVEPLADQISVEDLGSIYMAEVGDIVLLYDEVEQEFDTLYDMAAAPGDSFGFPSIYTFSCGPLDRCVVLDTGTMVMQGLPLKWLAVEWTYVYDPTDPPWIVAVPDTIIERIGAVNSYIYSMDGYFGATDGNEGGPMRCYSDMDISYNAGIVDLFSTEPLCDLLPTSVAQLEAERVLLYPDPGTDQLVVTGDREKTIELFDGCGRTVLQHW